MKDGAEVVARTKTSRLGPGEQSYIDHKIEYEIVKSHHNMLKLGALANILGGACYVLLLFHQDGFSGQMRLAIWYLILALTNIINMIWAMRYQSNLTIEGLKIWRHVFLFILGAICLTWGSIEILFYSGGIQYQLITMVFLLAVLICFSFSSVTDFTVAAISIICLLAPTISYRTYVGVQDIIATNHDVNFNLGISACFLVLGMFMLVTCYIGHNLIRKFFRLSFENVLLSNKLEKANLFLEQRVKERTTELENSLKLVKYQATHDLLTELPNHRLLLEYLHAAIDDARKNNHMFALACFTVNEIGKINEALGPQTGELILWRIAQRLQNIFNAKITDLDKLAPYTVTISRQDVFIILIHPIIGINEIESKVEFLFSILNDPVMIGDQAIQLTASIGVSVYPKDGLDINTLIMHTDAATLRAKQHGGNNIFVYEPGIDIDVSRRLKMDNQLRNALRNNEFVLQYQPFYDLKTERICGAEALIRWNNSSLGKVPPNEFIPIAEANGTIISIGEWILLTACEQTAFWHAKGFNTLQVSVNLSAKQLQQKNIVKMITDIITKTKLKPEFLKLELTESKAFREEVIPIINEITSLGISLSIDDFGTGYSAFSNLKLFKINQIKIDKSFIDDIITNKDSTDIVMNTIALGKRMNIKVLAEGVETKEQFEFLSQHECDMIQGYYFSIPLNPDEFTQLLEAERRRN